MSAERDMTRIVRSWLQVDEYESADRVLDIVLDLLDTTPQHRSAWPVRRFVVMNSYAKLAIAAVVVVVVAIGGLALLRPGESSGPGGAPIATPSPTPSPSAAPSPSPAASPSTIDTTDWVPFTSDRYGYTISYPPTHSGMPGSTKSAPTFVAQAQRDFAFGTDLWERSAGGELATTPLDWIVLGPDGYQIGFWGFAATVPVGTSVDDIISQGVGTRDPPGAPFPACESEPIMIDGQPGRFHVCGDSVSIAVVTIGDRAYVFVEGRGSVEKDLMLAQLSTVQLPTP
jgi:hypothetical protein